ncbi:hypothetical protein EYF80_038917 [Liparis tanakae]|uniref:Uncharacterized protein n=1 Tax=Liparis tanakae TaxID=230148 RepID=A0A4Z2GDB2_9TELE|nr:hypothetical protein EYF80_038917 [Liparis tanakae]
MDLYRVWASDISIPTICITRRTLHDYVSCHDNNIISSVKPEPEPCGAELLHHAIESGLQSPGSLVSEEAEEEE